MTANGGTDWARQPSVSAEESRTRTRLPKKLIVCCDGTWMDSDNSDQNPTNVTRITRAIASEDDHHHPQIVYYQAGIGTGLGLFNQIAGGATGLGLAENVREAYAFLASNYAENDELCPPDSIFLLGFSRGAYTARSLGGFICALGILMKHAMPHFRQIFNDWENAGDAKYKPQFFDAYFEHHDDVEKVKPDDELARNKHERERYLQDYFAKLQALRLTQKVEIKAIGVWDTVGALGIPVNPILQRLFWFLPAFIRGDSSAAWFDTGLDKKVRNAFQALALDERRYPYSPAVWERCMKCDTNVNLKQVWFPGAHSNVGGSYPDPGTADITLAWMMDQLSGNTMENRDEDFTPRNWIKFDEEYITEWYDCQLDSYTRYKRGKYHGWGMGKLYNSLTFPQSLAGRKVRTPGRYRKTNYETGRLMREHMENTNEFVHACVRARIDLDGPGIESDETKSLLGNLRPSIGKVWQWLKHFGHLPISGYYPQRAGGPLYGWSLRDGHKSHFNPNPELNVEHEGLDRIEWVYDGHGKAATPMPEDRLGKYEVMLLKKDPKIAGRMEFTNNGWRIRPKEPEPLPKHGKTL